MAISARRLMRANTAVGGGSTITHGSQVNASNSGIAALGLTRSGLTPTASGNLSTNGQTYTNTLFTSGVNVIGDNITLRGCQIEDDGSATPIVNVNGNNLTLENCTIVPPGAPGTLSAYMGVWIQGGDNHVIRGCDISNCENNISINDAGDVLIEDCYIHDASNASNPGGHRDAIEVYGADDVIIRRNKLLHPTGETAVINIAPWSGASHINSTTVDDNYIDGGHMHFVLDLQSTGYIRNTRVRRNLMGGHTTPTVGGRYWAVNNDRTIVQTEVALSSNPDAMLWPYTGPDVNYWTDCSDLTPDRTGMIINDPENYV